MTEYHESRVGGGDELLEPKHYDMGSLITIDVMLSDADDFEGGVFETLEPPRVWQRMRRHLRRGGSARGGGRLEAHAFERGDALIFCSHKYHRVTAVQDGERKVLVLELWEGEERRCAHRCRDARGPCTFRCTYDCPERGAPASDVSRVGRGVLDKVSEPPEE